MYHLAQSLYLHATSLPEYSILLLGLDAAGKTTLLNQIRNMYGKDVHNSKAGMVPDESAGRTVPTVGQNVCTIQLPNLYLRIWDIGGQQSLRTLWPRYFTSCHAIVFVIDSTDVGDGDLSRLPTTTNGSNASAAKSPRNDSSRNGTTEDYGRLDECAEVLSHVLADASTSGVPLLVLANKQDREDSVEVVRIKEGFVRRVVEGEGVADSAFTNSSTKNGGSSKGEGKDDAGGRPGGGGGGGGAYVRDSRVLPCSALSGQGVKEAVEWVSTRVGWNRESRPPVMR